VTSKTVFDVLVKVGGSLYSNPKLQNNLASWTSLAEKYRVLVVPGGGPFADAVRAADARFGLNDQSAHWMAILAMDQSAYLLADLTPTAALVRDLAAAETACKAGRLAVLAPSTLLMRLDPLPHSWQVTSDSIAAWLAGYAQIRLLVLLKSVSGVYQTGLAGKSERLLQQVSRQALSDHHMIDSYFTRALPLSTACWIIDGGQPERLIELLQLGSTVGTQVVEG
jgi:aspartokinase-like uncharacterized kinase